MTNTSGQSMSEKFTSYLTSSAALLFPSLYSTYLLFQPYPILNLQPLQLSSISRSIYVQTMLKTKKRPYN